MKRALVTYADSAQEDILNISLPFKQYFAEVFSYELISAKEPNLEGRSVYWAKIALLRELLFQFDEVLWLDADTMPIDFSEDPFSHLLPDKFQGLVMERMRWRFNPNVGVWAVRSSSLSQEFLDEVWEIGPLQSHIWPDQGAVLKALGWNIHPFPRGVYLKNPTRYIKDTGWLPPEWNQITDKENDTTMWKPRILHWAGVKGDHRRDLMLLAKEKYQRFLSQDL